MGQFNDNFTELAKNHGRDCEDEDIVPLAINLIAKNIHYFNRKWWTDLETGEPLTITPDLILSKLALVHSEVSEAVEGVRKDMMDDHLTDRKMVEVELADAVIRILDLAQAMQLDIGGALIEKCDYNITRADHSDEARKADNGKKV